MKRPTIMRRLLAILIVAVLIVAPTARPVMAGTTLAASTSYASTSAMAADISMSPMPDEMASDMPCCPSESSALVDCDKCVFMAACMGQFLAGPSAATFHPPFAASGKIAPLQNDSWPDGLGHPPPEDPPRTLV
jgi:hypothetical protein